MVDDEGLIVIERAKPNSPALQGGAMTKGHQPQRIIILGGGMASLAAAYQLVTLPDAQQRFDVTLYQVGWRLGGKCASARNPNFYGRVEEHGLHVWFGCYAQAFRMLRDCYRALGRESEMGQLFSGQTDTPYMEDHGGWKVWPVHFPRKNRTIGSDEEHSSATRFFDQVLSYGLARNRLLLHQVSDVAPSLSVEPALQLAIVTNILQGYLNVNLDDSLPPPEKLEIISTLVRKARDLIRQLYPDPESLGDDLRRALIEADLAHTTVIGIVADQVLYYGFDSIDKKDFRQWLQDHQAGSNTLVSAPVRALYDLCFAYHGGVTNWNNANFAAGAALNTVRRIVLDYVDYVVYEMRAGMGDMVIAPIYQFLRSRNVKFEFFHRATRLELARDNASVTAVHFARQVFLNNASYEPLIPAKGPLGGTMWAWPPEPDYHQIVNGGKVKGIDLESKWNGWTDVEPDRTLHADKDFDRIILGISFEEVKTVCADFARIGCWHDLFNHLQTVQTCSAQIWMTKTSQDLGWANGCIPVDAAPEPLDVWADRSEILKCELWPAGGPISLQYFCGPLNGDYTSLPANDPTIPASAMAAAVGVTRTWLENYGYTIWPRAGTSGRFDWTLLYDRSGSSGAARLIAQYVRANVTPSERYVLSVAGTTTYRLRANESQLTNLFLAGDWTRSDWNAGCVEAAVMTGFNAANAVAAPA
jgi:uncharacterized protein with NAD-binding domain and iron-sulfur cluster